MKGLLLEGIGLHVNKLELDPGVQLLISLFTRVDGRSCDGFVGRFLCDDGPLVSRQRHRAHLRAPFLRSTSASPIVEVERFEETF
jgi:hypothetical protein